MQITSQRAISPLNVTLTSPAIQPTPLPSGDTPTPSQPDRSDVVAQEIIRYREVDKAAGHAFHRQPQFQNVTETEDLYEGDTPRPLGKVELKDALKTTAQLALDTGTAQGIFRGRDGALYANTIERYEALNGQADWDGREALPGHLKMTADDIAQDIEEDLRRMPLPPSMKRGPGANTGAEGSPHDPVTVDFARGEGGASLLAIVGTDSWVNLDAANGASAVQPTS